MLFEPIGIYIEALILGEYGKNILSRPSQQL